MVAAAAPSRPRRHARAASPGAAPGARRSSRHRGGGRAARGADGGARAAKEWTKCRSSGPRHGAYGAPGRYRTAARRGSRGARAWTSHLPNAGGQCRRPACAPHCATRCAGDATRPRAVREPPPRHPAHPRIGMCAPPPVQACSLRGKPSGDPLALALREWGEVQQPPCQKKPPEAQFSNKNGRGHPCWACLAAGRGGRG